jgi:O-antigen ligase
MQSGADVDYRLKAADIDEWEKTNGRLPEGAVVLLYTGWGRHWNNYPRYKNQDATGKMHFPGYSAEAAKYLFWNIGVGGVVYLAVSLRQPWAAGVAALTFVCYVFVYTPLKSRTTWNTIIGAIPGALPPDRSNLMTIHLFSSCPMGEDRGRPCLLRPGSRATQCP